jgi:hypothetical protein
MGLILGAMVMPALLGSVLGYMGKNGCAALLVGVPLVYWWSSHFSDETGTNTLVFVIRSAGLALGAVMGASAGKRIAR